MKTDELMALVAATIHAGCIARGTQSEFDYSVKQSVDAAEEILREIWSRPRPDSLHSITVGTRP